MTTINDKLGLPRPGKRPMMKLPQDRSARNQVTSAKCPHCERTGARPSRTKGAGWLFCSWCSHLWERGA